MSRRRRMIQRAAQRPRRVLAEQLRAALHMTAYVRARVFMIQREVRLSGKEIVDALNRSRL